jgi:hypothetical protein
MALALLLIGAWLIITGTAILSWPAGVIVAGVCCVVAGYDLTRPTRS